MSREVQVRFCESRAVQSRPATHLVVHCVTERQAQQVRQAIGRRFADIGLQLHPDKTRIVYCKDDRRRLDYHQVTFTFCGYAFRPRKSWDKSRGKARTGFLPAVAPGKLTDMSRKALLLFPWVRFGGAAQGAGPLLPGQGRLRRRCREGAARPPGPASLGGPSGRACGQAGGLPDRGAQRPRTSLGQVAAGKDH